MNNESLGLLLVFLGSTCLITEYMKYTHGQSIRAVVSGAFVSVFVFGLWLMFKS